MASTGSTAPFMVIDTDMRSRGMPSNRIWTRKGVAGGGCDVEGEDVMWETPRHATRANCACNQKARHGRLHDHARQPCVHATTFMSSTESMATPAMPTSPPTRG
jgi:hypothetical protein